MPRQPAVVRGGLHRITVSNVQCLSSTLCLTYITTKTVSRASEFSATINISICPRHLRVRGCCDAFHATHEARQHDVYMLRTQRYDMSRVAFQVCFAHAGRTNAAIAHASRREQTNALQPSEGRYKPRF